MVPRIALGALLLAAACKADGEPARDAATDARDAAPEGAPEVAAEVVPEAPASADTGFAVVGAHATWPIANPAAGGASYTVTADTVTDAVTKLVWQRATAPGTYQWAPAAAYCDTLTLAGASDWRLPTRIELTTLVDFTRHTPTIDTAAFPDTPSQWFWTSSPLSDIAGFAWYVYFETGFSNYIDGDYEYHVRCVRGARGNWPGYTVTADAVTDPGTGLTWQRQPDDVERTWAEARAFCAARAGGPWRLPTMRELQTIVDDSRADPAIDATAFPDTPSDSFWSATLFAPIPGNAWRTSFQRGYTYDSMVDATYRTRCVRATTP